jgi:hypothetical protein
LTGGALSGLDTEIGSVEKSVVGALGDASVLHVGQGLVDKVKLWTGGGAGSVGIKSELSEGTELEAFSRS